MKKPLRITLSLMDVESLGTFFSIFLPIGRVANATASSIATLKARSLNAEIELAFSVL